MRALKIAAIVIIGLGTVITVGYFALIIYINLPTGRTLARNVSVTQEWTEIVVEPAIGAEYHHQNVSLDIPNIDWPEKIDGIHMTDGTELRPQIELVDEQGTTQPLKLSGFTQKYGVAADYGSVAGTAGFSNGRKFIKLRIRSDRPFDCSTIVWIDYNPP